ncbi:MAG: SpoIIE family protein phosphatase [Verrucomicrobiota bacterium]
MKTGRDTFIEIAFEQQAKQNQLVSGDLFLSTRVREQGRIIAVLADGLGSGVKASVLSTLTGALAARCVRGNMDVRRTAEVILSSLPVCRERQLAYSTFTILDLDKSTGELRIIEHENPRFLLLRNGQAADCETERIPIDGPANSSRHHRLLYSRVRLNEGDRVLVFSDGLTQAGLGRRGLPQGWGENGVRQAALDLVRGDPDISAQEMTAILVQRALANDAHAAKDDMTCASLYLRRPRNLLVVTGPPFDPVNDSAIARRIADFRGRTLLCGGTTAAIVARELGREIKFDDADMDPDIPPASRLEGIDLVTEGTLTLEELARVLERGRDNRRNAATQAAGMMLHSDRIHFLVGSRINDAHQDPAAPMQLDIRRNIVRRIRAILEQQHLKETTLELT